jgi:hypothetical protein
VAQLLRRGEGTMKRPDLSRFCTHPVFPVMLAALLSAFLMAASAYAQHSGAHAGGTAAHAGGAPHAPVQPAGARPIVTRPAVPWNNSFLVRPPGIQVLPRPFAVGYPRPISPRNPFLRVPPVAPPILGVFGVPFFGLGFGWGFYGGPWLGCSPLLYWGYSCNGLAAYEYGSGTYAAPVQPYAAEPQMEIQNAPVYYNYYGEANSQYPELVLKDGTTYFVTDYWLENNELHYKTVEDQGSKVVEHTVDFDQLDLQTTVDVNTQRGFRFVLRNEPLEQYLIDHPGPESPGEAPAEPPQEPQPAQP